MKIIFIFNLKEKENELFVRFEIMTDEDANLNTKNSSVDIFFWMETSKRVGVRAEAKIEVGVVRTTRSLLPSRWLREQAFPKEANFLDLN